jgi:hypothetical protein
MMEIKDKIKFRKIDKINRTVNIEQTVEGKEKKHGLQKVSGFIIS